MAKPPQVNLWRDSRPAHIQIVIYAGLVALGFAAARIADWVAKRAEGPESAPLVGPTKLSPARDRTLPAK
ncbi:MAG TPA: hypothetical protein VHQ87_05710 [Rhizobacter sp.]|jgi:hypothetical protein|nr:hypothetical protein [Rhizobacter sp.]